VVSIAADKSNPPDPALTLIHALGCKGCHRIQEDGGSLAPDLTQVGSRLTADQINSQLTAHTDTRTKGFMPSYSSLAQEDLELISKYLYNLR
jgi:cytochrome c2